MPTVPVFFICIREDIKDYGPNGKEKFIWEVFFLIPKMLVPTENTVLTKMQISETVSTLPFEHRRPA